MLLSRTPTVGGFRNLLEREAARKRGIGYAVLHVGMEMHSEALMDLGVAGLVFVRQRRCQAS